MSDYFRTYLCYFLDLDLTTDVCLFLFVPSPATAPSLFVCFLCPCWLPTAPAASDAALLHSLFTDLCRHQFDDKFGAKVLEYHNTVKVKYDEAEALHIRQVQKMQSKHAKDYLEDAFGLDAGTSPPRSSSTLESKAGLHGGSGRLARCKRILFDKGDMTFGVWHAALVPFDS